MDPRKYGESYEERIRLKDGRPVELRLLKHADAMLLRRGFDQLSDRSRYQRFCAPKPRLTDSEVQYFTEVDGERHFAIGAVQQVDGEEKGLGVARFIRLDERPDVAEPAIVVVDAAQGIGLGSALMQRLMEAAHERGIRAFEFFALGDNGPLDRMIATLPGDALEPMPDGFKRIHLDRMFADARDAAVEPSDAPASSTTAAACPRPS